MCVNIRPEPIRGTKWTSVGMCAAGRALATPQIQRDSLSWRSYRAGVTQRVARDRRSARNERRRARALFAVAGLRDRLLGRARLVAAARPGLRRARRPQ